MFSYFKIATLSLVLILVHSTIGQQSQLIQFWNSANCVGNPFASWTASANYTTPPPGLTQPLYYKVNGLWEIIPCLSPTNCTVPWIRSGFPGPCTQLLFPYNLTDLRVRRIGDANQNERKITFFELPNFQGQSISVVPPETNFSSRTAQSYYFTGLNSWVYKSSPDNFISVCYNYSLDVKNAGYGFTYSEATIANIGYVKYGCDVQQSTTTRKPGSSGGGIVGPNNAVYYAFILVFALICLKY